MRLVNYNFIAIFIILLLLYNILLIIVTNRNITGIETGQIFRLRATSMLNVV